MGFNIVHWVGNNTELVFRVGLFGFLFGVILMLIDKDFEKRFENNGFIRKAFALRIPLKLKMKTEPFGTIFAITGASIAFLALNMAGN